MISHATKVGAAVHSSGNQNRPMLSCPLMAGAVYAVGKAASFTSAEQATSGALTLLKLMFQVSFLDQVLC
jgi:hypothetical protein